MDKNTDALIDKHARALLDMANRQVDEVSAIGFLNERLSAWGPQVGKEHFQAVSARLGKLSATKGDRLPTVEIVAREGFEGALVIATDLSKNTTQQLACKTIERFVSERDAELFSNLKAKVSHNDYQDILEDSNKILKQLSDGRLELHMDDGSDEDKRPDKVYGVIEKSTKTVASPTTSQGGARRIDALEMMPAFMANSEAAANLAWESFFTKSGDSD